MPALSISQVIGLALQHHQAGRLGDAEALCRAVLENDPGNAEALHLLGVVALHSGRDEAAVELIQKALAHAPHAAAFHSNLGVALEGLRRFEPAAAAYREALVLDPADAGTHSNLGNALKELGRLEEAIAAHRRAVEIEPQSAAAHNNLGNVLRRAGQLEAAVASYRRALEGQPTHAGAHNNLGNALRELGRLEEAMTACRRALELQPDFAEAHNNLGNLLSDHGRFEEALAAYQRALQIRPGYAMAHNNRGNVLRDRGQVDEAIAAYRQALQLQPDYAEVHNNLANAFAARGHLEEAVAAYQEALRCRPDYPEAHNNLGVALKEQGNLAGAMAAYRRALELQPDFPEAHSNLIFTLDLMESVELATQQAERRLWYEQHGRKFAAHLAPPENAPDPERRLRVGYVSADFCRHSACAAFGPVVAGHDAAQFEVYCYSGVRREDEMTARLRATAHAWRSTVGVPDDAMAGQIRRDRIDVLVDLSGHSAGNRLLVFARRPAPVQVTAWGHATATGLATMDYLLADPVWVPPEDRGHYVERIIDLPCVLCFEPPAYLPEINRLPALSGSPLTYGCANRLEKITDSLIALWGRILRAQPGARLLLKDKAFNRPGLRTRFLQRLLEVGGIGEERVLLFGSSSHLEHLRIFHQVDIALDPYPQNGGASTGEALWMGVPVVSLHGSAVATRAGAAILTHVGLAEWIATTGDEYVRIAVEAARDLPRLARLRSELRAMLAATEYGDLARYTHAVEATYRRIWREWCERPM